MAGLAGTGAMGCSDCAYRDFVVAEAAAYFDPTLSNEVRIEARGGGSAATTLAVQNYPSLGDSMALGQSGGVPLDDDTNSDPGSCGLCVTASRGANIFTPLRGSAQVAAPAAAGQPFSVTFDDVALQRVDPLSGAPLDDGRRWCLPSGTALTATTGPWPCANVADLLPGASLTEGQSVCFAEASSATYLLWTCSQGSIVRGTDCAGLGKACDPAANASGAAVCQ